MVLDCLEAVGIVAARARVYIFGVLFAGASLMRLITFFLAGLVFASAATAQEVTSAEAATASQRAVPTATVARAEMTEMQARVPVTGTLVARQDVQVFAQVSGFEITEILVEAGDQVQAGQVLARLSDETLTAQLAQAEAEYQRAVAGVGQANSQIASTEASLTQAVTALERVQKLRSSGNAPQATLDQAVATEANARAQANSAADGLAVANAALAQALAARNLAQLDVQRTQIMAPVPGLVVTRNAQLGAIASGAGDPLFRIVANDEIELSAEVIETDLLGLVPDLPAEINVAGIGPVQGHVRLVPASVDPVTRLGVLRIALEDDQPLRTGVFASGSIVTQRRQALSVPTTAVLSDHQGQRVQIVKDGAVHSRPVTAGLVWDGRREILSGLEAGETVIARAGAFFRDGDKVNAVSSDAPDPAPKVDAAP